MFEYDERNRLKKQTQQVGSASHITQFSYDQGDRVSQVIDPRNLITSYEYDGFGQLWKQTSPDTGITTHVWNAQGQRSTTTRADAVTLTYGYDGLGRQTTVTAGSGANAITHTTVWDSNINCANGKGKICKLTDPHQSLVLSYTPYGEPTQQVATIDGQTFSHYFEHDALGRLTKITYPDNVLVNYDWTWDQVTTMTATIAGQKRTIASNIAFTGNTYENAGGQWHLRHGNGRDRDELTDTDGRYYGIASIAKGIQLGRLHDAHDRVTEVLNWNEPGHGGMVAHQLFGYDDMDRLTSIGYAESQPGLDAPPSITFQYDANGNRTVETFPGGSRLHTLPTNSNRLDEIHASGHLERRYGYKATGEVTSIQGLWQGQPNTTEIFANGFEDGAPLTHAQFTYDSFNRLIGIDTPWLDADFEVAATGMRIAKTINGKTTRFVYSQDGQLLYEKDAQTGQSTYHLYLHGQPIAMVRNGQIYWVHTDQLGRPELLADQNGNTKWRAKLEAFDRTVIQDQVDGYHLGFPGQYHDIETGFVYNIFRDYDPTTGRYLQPDPIGLAGGINPYVYVGGNPVSLVDPLGLEGIGYWNSAATLGSWSQSPGDLVNFCAGAGDAVLLGFGDDIRDAFGIDGGIDSSSEAYQAGSWAAFAGGTARVGYAGLAKGYSMLAPSGTAASAFRYKIKHIFGLGFTDGIRKPNLFGKTQEQLRRSAGRTNWGVNAYGAGVAVAGASGGCECRE